MVATGSSRGGEGACWDTWRPKLKVVAVVCGVVLGMEERSGGLDGVVFL